MKSHLKFGTAKVYIYRQLEVNCSPINSKLAIKNGISVKKRVCHISYNHDAFDDRIYWKELIALTEAGYETIHICVGEEDKDFITNEGVRIIQIKRASNSKNIWLQRFKFILFRKNETIDRILDKAKGLEADVYHYHDLQINAIVKEIKNFPTQPKIIYDCHEAYHLLMINNLSKQKFKLMFKKLILLMINKWEKSNAKLTDFIIANYPYVQNYFNKKIPNVPSFIIHNYNFLPEESLTNTNETKKIYDFLYTGQLTRERGINEMIKAFSLIHPQEHNYKMLLIGKFESAEYESEVKNLIKESNLKSNVIIHPSVPFSKMRQYYKQSKIGLCLWHNTPIFRHALPIKLFEYMSFGLPIIFAQHGPSVSIINECHCGLIVNEQDEKSIAGAMYELTSNNSLKSNFSQNALKATINQYNWEKEKSEFLQIYHDLL